MQLFPIHTGIIALNENATDRIIEALNEDGVKVEGGDVLAITSKVISVSEGRVVDLNVVKPSSKARILSRRYTILPEICELILREADLIIGGIEGVLLTLKNNTLIANAGIDKKNAGPNRVVLHPRDPTGAADQIRKCILDRTGNRVGVIVTDSRTQPLRIGTIGVALGVSGFEPVIDERGKPDLFGRPLQVTKRALADELATAAEILMGETTECVPAVLIKNAPIILSDSATAPSSLCVSPNDCFYTKILSEFNTHARRRRQSEPRRPS